MNEKELDTVLTDTEQAAQDGMEDAAEASVEATEATEAAEAAAPAKKHKKEKVRRRLHLNGDTLEWMSTAALAGLILYLGFLAGTLFRAGFGGLQLVALCFSDWFSDLLMGVLVLYALLCSTLCKKHSPLWLGIPSAVYAGMAIFKAYRPAVLLASFLMVYAENPAAGAAYVQIVPTLVLVLVTYLLQLLMLISFMLLLGGKGCRWLHVSLCVLWFAGIAVCNFPSLSLSFAENAPRVMQLLSFACAALMFALPAFSGKRVPACELRSLQAADAQARKSRKAKPETIAVIPAADAENTDDIAETTDLSWGTDAAWDVVEVQEAEDGTGTDEAPAVEDTELPDDLLSDLPQADEPIGE